MDFRVANPTGKRIDPKRRLTSWRVVLGIAKDAAASSLLDLIGFVHFVRVDPRLHICVAQRNLREASC